MSEQKRTCEDERRGREPTAVHREVQEKELTSEGMNELTNEGVAAKE